MCSACISTRNVPIDGLSAYCSVHPVFLFLDGLVADVFVVLHEFVDGADGSQLYDACRNGFNELVVVRAEKDVALEKLKVVVEGLNAFEVEVVRVCVENEAIKEQKDRMYGTIG